MPRHENQFRPLLLDRTRPVSATDTRALYQGTETQLIDSILSEELMPLARQRVHLSADEPTARRVDQRHGNAESSFRTANYRPEFPPKAGFFSSASPIRPGP